MFLSALGGGIIIWAALDLLMNFIRAGSDLFGRPDQIEFCTIAEIGRLFRAPLVFLALDTLMTFSIICFVLWSGLIQHLTRSESVLWNTATTLNLISISLVALWTEIQRTKKGLPAGSRRIKKQPGDDETGKSQK